MDDISAKISELLGTQEGIKQITDMAQQLGIDPSQLDGILGGEVPPKKEKPQQDVFDGINVETLLKVQKLMSKMNSNNNDTALLDALKPYMSAERSRKIDDAKRIMNLMQIIPLINSERGQL